MKHGEAVSRDLDLETSKALAEYLSYRRKNGGGIRGKVESDGNQLIHALFITGKNGNRLTRKSLSRIQKRIREEAGVNKRRAGFHAERRGRITSLYNAGVKRNALIKEWGWRNDSTVDTYIQPELEEVKEQVRNAHPFFKKT